MRASGDLINHQPHQRLVLGSSSTTSFTVHHPSSLAIADINPHVPLPSPEGCGLVRQRSTMGCGGRNTRRGPGDGRPGGALRKRAMTKVVARSHLSKMTTPARGPPLSSTHPRHISTTLRLAKQLNPLRQLTNAPQLGTWARESHWCIVQQSGWVASNRSLHNQTRCHLASPLQRGM